MRYDLDNDGSITLQDSWLMLSLLAGDITKFPGQRSPGALSRSTFRNAILPLSIQRYLRHDHRRHQLQPVRSLPGRGVGFEIADGMSGKNGFDGIKLGDLDGSNISAPAPAQFRGCPEGNPAFLYEQLPLAAYQAIELDIRYQPAPRH
ncbi:MAG: hypothetical protein H6559_34395 [Lewinellaceae bacterium]|nr:hypothetical protein [Lewinellaceae bacterium]